MQKKIEEKSRLPAPPRPSMTAPADALPPEPEPTAPKRVRVVGVDASTGNAVLEEVEE